jgi:DNA recombination protein RmuC
MIPIILLIVLIIIAIVNIFLLLGKKTNNNEDLVSKLMKLDADISRLDPLLRDEFARNRTETQNALKENREEQSKSFQMFSEAQTKNITDLYNAQKNLLESYHNRLKEIQEAIEKKLSLIQEDNNKKLDEMRKTVDEKLQESVEKRFNESFKLINERLEAVHKGLGEMQNLATGVGDLKKVLTNVKSRGVFGEVQLGAILEQFLSPEQYVKNDHPDDENERRIVEFSIKLTGNEKDDPVLLPIDSKFPIEDYQRFLEA